MSTAKLCNSDYKSAIMQHAADTGHSFRENDVKILDSDPNWIPRGIRESIYIRALNPSLSRRSDWNDHYTLRPTHNSIIKSAIKPPASPTPHSQTETRSFRGQRNTSMSTTPTIATESYNHSMTTRRVIPNSGFLPFLCSLTLPFSPSVHLPPTLSLFPPKVGDLTKNSRLLLSIFAFSDVERQVKPNTTVVIDNHLFQISSIE